MMYVVVDYLVINLLIKYSDVTARYLPTCLNSRSRYKWNWKRWQPESEIFQVSRVRCDKKRTINWMSRPRSHGGNSTVFDASDKKSVIKSILIKIN